MASSGKQKTTTAKRVREAKLRERRIEKQARKDARKLAATDRADTAESPTAEDVTESPTTADAADSPTTGETDASTDSTLD